MHRIIRSWPAVGLVAALSVVAMVSPASAQYAGNERDFIVSPLRVPAGSDLSGLGFGCTPTSTVTITIQGEAGIFTTVVAEDDSTYAFSNMPISPTLVIGDTYTAVASCDGVFETADFTVICASGDEPDINGDCPIPPTTTTTTTTTTTVPGASTTTTLVPTTTVAPTTTIDSGTGSVSDPLAITGAGTLRFFQFAATLVGVGVLFMMLGRRRDRNGEPAQAY